MPPSARPVIASTRSSAHSDGRRRRRRSASGSARVGAAPGAGAPGRAPRERRHSEEGDGEQGGDRATHPPESMCDARTRAGVSEYSGRETQVTTRTERDRAIMRRYARTPRCWRAAPAAILLQLLADPRVVGRGRGAAGSVSVRWTASASTYEYLMALWFGDERDIRHVVARRRCPSRTRPRRRRARVDARDPDAQRWVAATILYVETDSSAHVARPARSHGRCPVRAYGSRSRAPAGPRRARPSTRAEFDACGGDRMPRAYLSGERAVARDLLAVRGLPTLRPLMPPPAHHRSPAPAGDQGCVRLPLDVARGAGRGRLIARWRGTPGRADGGAHHPDANIAPSRAGVAGTLRVTREDEDDLARIATRRAARLDRPTDRR